MWSLYKGDKLVKPLRYSNGKTQEQVVDELIDALRHHDIVFFKGAVGTGKSAIALHVVKHFGTGHIVVPTKVLERQYHEDYFTGKYKIPGLNIHMMMGKGNYHCLFIDSYCGDKLCPCSCPLNKGETRTEVAKVCPFWSPIFPSEMSQKVKHILERYNNTSYRAADYQSIRGIRTHIVAPIPCKYYECFKAYTDPRSHATIFNSAKWDIEMWIGRKPKVPIEIIDEGDAYLDNLTYKVFMNNGIFDAIERNGLVPEDNIKIIKYEFERLMQSYKTYSGILSNNTRLIRFLETFIEILDAVSTDGMVCEMCNKILLMLRHTSNSFVKISRGNLVVYIPRPDITLNEIRKRSGKLLFMSATFQHEDILKDIYGINDVVMVEGETKFPGKLIIKKTGKEVNINKDKWDNYQFRRVYWSVLNKMIKRATRPTLVQVHGYKYVPPNTEVNKRKDVWWSTVTDRGIDLHDDHCRSVIILKYPYPDLSDPVLKTMKALLNNRFWSYYRDIARRDLIQQIGRGLRHKNDWVELWSPDKMVMDDIIKIWNGEYVVDRIEVT